VSASGQVLLLDGAADRDQRPERQRGKQVVLEAGYPQKGGEMRECKVYRCGDWKLIDRGALIGLYRNDILLELLTRRDADELAKCMNSRVLDNTEVE